MSLSPRSLLMATVLVVVFYSMAVFLPMKERLRLVPDALSADGSSSARLHWSMGGLFGHNLPLWPWAVELKVLKGAERVRILGGVSRLAGTATLDLALVGTGLAGPVELELVVGPWRHALHLDMLAPDLDADRDSDGFPDSAELFDPADRRAFTAWFTSIAESQFYRPDPRWARVHRDCAGLARFAYKEALRPHHGAWLAKSGYLHRVPKGDVERFSYPQVPLLGTRLFRNKAGPWRRGQDATDDFSASASARVLAEHNMVFLSKDRVFAQAGDLLFFHDPEQEGSGYHSMILLDGNRVVYHTGGGDGQAGETRLVRLADLDAHKDERWHVRPDNPHFLGFFRWKILEGGRP
ncbi:MAG: DUF1175 family protein [Deltaproteobacteria bacterium]|nr:DUF1175 family protein [Deltaproteobacteria bacterium]